MRQEVYPDSKRLEVSDRLVDFDLMPETVETQRCR